MSIPKIYLTIIMTTKFADKKINDFTLEDKHTKFFDCYILCRNSVFMCHRHILCKLDFFNNIFAIWC